MFKERHQILGKWLDKASIAFKSHQSNSFTFIPILLKLMRQQATAWGFRFGKIATLGACVLQRDRMRYERWRCRIKAKKHAFHHEKPSLCLWQRQNRILLNYCSIQASLLRSGRAAFPTSFLGVTWREFAVAALPNFSSLQGHAIVMECCFQAYLGILRTHYRHPVSKNT